MAYLAAKGVAVPRLACSRPSKVAAVSVLCTYRIYTRTNLGASRTIYRAASAPSPAPPAVADVPVPQQQITQSSVPQSEGKVEFKGVHHVALICSNLEKSLEFYQGVLGLTINPDRPHHKLPYRGAWLWIGSEMIHLMELPNPDPLESRPEHGGRDRHTCVGVQSVEPLIQKLEAAGIPFTKSMSGRPAIFFRDPDMNCLECAETESWR